MRLTFTVSDALINEDNSHVYPDDSLTIDVDTSEMLCVTIKDTTAGVVRISQVYVNVEDAIKIRDWLNSVIVPPVPASFKA